MRLSIVIPTLNESSHLPTTVEVVRKHASLDAGHELIVADCGSVDGTGRMARRLGCRVVCSDPAPANRAAALDLGAAHATGDVLLFLDADTLAPRGYDASIHQALRDPRVVGGAFEFALDGARFGLRVVEWINRVRYRIRQRYYGDQGIFVRRSAFERIGGYGDLPIMEASNLCKRLRRIGRLRLVRKPMRTSPRRFLEGGILRVLAFDAKLWSLDLLGAPVRRFGSEYRASNVGRGGG